jgi:site-specific DNA recombinase
MVATSKKGTKKYRYYVCTSAQRNGWHTCPSKSVPAGEMEQFVIDQIRSIGCDPELAAATVAQAKHQTQTRLDALVAERRGLDRELGRCNQELQSLAHVAHSGRVAGKLADLQGRMATSETRLGEVAKEVELLGKSQLDEQEAVAALAAFDPVWETLSPREQLRMMQLLVARVEYDGAAGKIAVTLNTDELSTLAEELLVAEEAV